MFQTAACIGYAKQHGYKWGIPPGRANNDNDPWLLSQFWPNLPVTGMQGVRYQQHDPKDFNYKPIQRFDGNVTLVGFFQSEKWFENAKEEVKSAFPLKHYPEYEGYVSIHIRRGDYVTNSKSFPPITREYVLNAIYHLPSPFDWKPYFFSDDIEWCKQTFKDFPEAKFENGLTEFEALSHMAACSHHIIANSTFSWWGAWLGHNPNKIVVSPSSKNWFGPGFTGGEPVDLIPENWIQIHTR
jgi:hypothetical protein